MVFPRQEHWSGLPFLLQEIFLSQKSHLGPLNWQEDLYHGATGEAHAAADHLLKPTQGTVPSVSPSESCGSWVLFMYSHGFIS